MSAWARRLLFWGALSAAVAVTVVAPLVVEVVSAFAQAPVRSAAVAVEATGGGLATLKDWLGVIAPAALILVAIGVASKTIKVLEKLTDKLEQKQTAFEKEIKGEVDATEARLAEEIKAHHERHHGHDRRIDKVASELKAHRDNPAAHKAAARGPYQGSDSDNDIARRE